MPCIFLHNLFLVDLKNNSVRPSQLLICNNKISKIFSCNSKATKIIKNFRHNFPDIQIYNLKGGYVIPGFTDGHIHLLGYGIEKQRVSLSSCGSLDECLQRLNSAKEEDLIFGVNWDESNWRQGKKEDLNRQILDRISKNKPVIMRRICGHFAVCNTKALESISSNWRIVDRKNGYLYEDAALYLNQIFKPSLSMYKKGIDIAMEHALSLGITSVHEITDLYGFARYQQFRDKLKIRIAIYLQNGLIPAVNCGLRSNFGDDFLKFSGVKLFMDGSIGARTAAINNPYQNTKNRGKLLISEERLVKIIKYAECYSIQLMIHSIGDRSTDTVLNAFNETGMKTNKLRHRIEHLEILNDKQIHKIAHCGLIASMQPNFLRWQSAGNMYEKNLGLRYKEMNCFKKVKAAAIRLIFGSDGMPPGPLYGINLAINNPFKWIRLTPVEAIRLYAETAPYATFDENKKGKIAEGQFADIVVLNKNPLVKHNYDELKILMVIINGRIAWKNNKFTILL